MFITFEGIDGAGKTTQAKYVKEFLENLGYRVILTKEPGGTKFGEKIRSILLTEEMDGYSEFLLFAADRNMHVKTLIKPKLKEGYIVLSDRFAESSIAYQGFGRGVDLDFIERVHNEILLNTYPDLIFLIDIPVKVALNRLESKDRIEKSGEDFLQRVRNGYL
ncbi:MAG: dTMP kinase, partial [Caldisericaceae bacterium]